MDNLRGQFPDHEDAHDSAQDFDPAEDEVAGDLPPASIGQDERRMQVRAYNFWAALLNERNFPASTDFDPHGQPDFGPYSVLLNFAADIENPSVAYLGDKLAAECDSNGNIERLSDVPSRSLLSRITDHYLQIIANQAPIGFEAEFVNQRGATILYRGILLPFSSDDKTIDFIYGVINWKELADQQTADELLLEIDQALEANRWAKHEDLPMTEWADGPVDHLSPLDLDTPIYDEIDDEHGDELGEYPEPGFSTDELYAPLHRVAGNDSDTFRMSDVALEGGQRTLSDWLADARDHADEAANCEKRTHHALYAAIATAHDFALAAKAHPDEYCSLLEDCGLAMQDRAPMVPIAKLVFGISYDKTRLAEYAAVLDHAARLGLGEGGLARLLGETAGGLKALVAEERRLRKLDSGKSPANSGRDELVEQLRAMAGHGLDEISTSGAEFTLLVARRSEGGLVEILGEVDDQPALTEKAARRLIG